MEPACCRYHRRDSHAVSNNNNGFHRNSEANENHNDNGDYTLHTNHTWDHDADSAASTIDCATRWTINRHRSEHWDQNYGDQAAKHWDGRLHR